MKLKAGTLLKCINVKKGAYGNNPILGDIYKIVYDCEKPARYSCMINMINIKTGYQNSWYMDDFESAMPDIYED